MKKLILLISIILTLNNINAQSQLIVNTSLAPYLITYIEDAMKRGYNVMPTIVENLDAIVEVENLPITTNGIYSADTRTVYVNFYTEPFVKKVTLYHELGHFFNGTGHSCETCYNIMSEWEYDLDFFRHEENWEKELDNYFKYIFKKYDTK